MHMLSNLRDVQRMNQIGSRAFWKENRSKMPRIYRLAVLLWAIAPSSAFIERHYSLCGNLASQRRLKMEPEEIIRRAMIKANMALLEDLVMS